MKQQLEQLKQEYKTLKEKYNKQQSVNIELLAEINKLNDNKKNSLQDIDTFKNLSEEATRIITQHKLQEQKYQLQQDINRKLSEEINKLNDDKKNSLQQTEIYKKLSLEMTNILNNSSETNSCQKDASDLFAEMLQQNSQNNNDIDDNKEEIDLSGNIAGYD